MPLLVGNDVVDLADPRCVGRSEDGRFMARILSDAESREVRRSEAPDVLLWLHWAAKEAAFKVASKIRAEPPPFTHTSFVVQMESPLASRVAGWVSWEALLLPVHASVERDRIHAVGWRPEPGARDPRALPQEISAQAEPLPGPRAPEDWRQQMVGRFTEREWAPVHGWPSAVVRLKARAEVARCLGVAEGRLEIVCPGDAPGRVPPEVLLDGAPAPADVSLSHHGRFVAWAVAARR